MQLRLALLAFVLVSPVTVAGWSVKGNHEPSVAADVTDGWMFTQPDTSADAGRRVYFNGFFGQCTFPCYLPVSGLSPNLGTARTATFTTLMYSYAALGVWKDCNRDGYVGFGDQGLFEYRSELLVATSPTVCAAVATPIDPLTKKPPMGWQATHNDGEWVREFLPLSRDDSSGPLGDPQPWNIDDAGTMVWVDGGLPGAEVSGYGCWTNPQPRGTWHGTGGVLEYADCHVEFVVTDSWNGAVAFFGGDSLGVGQLSFSDKPRDQSESSSRLNVRSPWGEQEDAAMVEAWDCSQGTTSIDTPPASAPPVVAPGQHLTNVSMPNTAPSLNPAGSPSGTVNATASGVDECERSEASGKTAGGLAMAPYSPGVIVGEGGVTNTDVKRGTTALSPVSTRRPAAPFALVAGLGRAVPPDLGARHVGWDGFWQGGAIIGGNAFVDTSRGQLLPVTHVTFYGYVSASAVSTHGLTLPKGASTGSYGFEACAGASSGIVKGWDCDPAAWAEPKVGRAYNVRDIDCYDSSVAVAREEGVGWGIMTGTSCGFAPET